MIPAYVDAAATAAGAKGWLAHLLSRGFVDRLHASFQGRDGNRCEIAKTLGKPVQTELRASTTLGSATKAEVEADVGPPQSHNLAAAGAIGYREVAPEDALEVARCFYRTYGATAPVADEVIYHPEKCAAQVRAGLHLGTVAVLPNGRIVGHNRRYTRASERPGRNQWLPGGRPGIPRSRDWRPSE
jgi:hypothetical protein